MIPTPDLSHLTQDDYDKVYEPAEDTFLLLDALEQDARELRNLGPLVCLEIGSGSGCVSCFLGHILGSSAALFLCTDINPHASKCTFASGRQNRVPLESISASLAGPLLPRLKNLVDILLFNPPYVPTITEEAVGAQLSTSIGASWAGGASGMHITNNLLDIVPELLSHKGHFYLVAVRENDIPTIRMKMLEIHALQSDVVLQRRAGREHLFVLRFRRPNIAHNF